MEHLNYHFRDTCRMCNSKNLTEAVNLSPTPPGNDFLSINEINRPEQVYPLDLYFCKECFHVQLGHVVDPAILYQKNYTYVSSTSKHFLNHLEQYSKDMIKRFKLSSKSLVVDIGSNDGACLNFFQKKGIKILGVDPATDIAINASANGIETINDFFSHELASNIRERYGPASFITSHNACAHIDDLFDVFLGVECLLKNTGIFVLEVGYLVDVYLNTWFDTIYHEHLDFHTIGPFQKLFARVGMEIIDVERISPQGGSIRIISQKKNGKFKQKDSVLNLIKLEKKIGLYDIETFYRFENKINQVKERLLRLVLKLKSSNKSIAGFGAPTKATTLMSHFDIDASILDFIVDDNPLKQGLYTPVSHIPIFSTDELNKRNPDYVIILAWNFATPIMENNKKYLENGGKFILPMPEPRIAE